MTVTAIVAVITCVAMSSRSSDLADRRVALDQDDGTVRTKDGLSVGTRADTYVEVLSDRRVSVGSAIVSTLAKGSEFAKLEVKTSLLTDRTEQCDAVAATTVEATACGARLWSRTFTTKITI